LRQRNQKQRENFAFTLTLDTIKTDPTIIAIASTTGAAIIVTQMSITGIGGIIPTSTTGTTTIGIDKLRGRKIRHPCGISGGRPYGRFTGDKDAHVLTLSKENAHGVCHVIICTTDPRWFFGNIRNGSVINIYVKAVISLVLDDKFLVSKVNI
jgi:hypothetical protein